jgi:translocation and assembly module TamA
MTAVGPIRLDAAVPIDPRPGDPAFAVYFGIGQSF